MLKKVGIILLAALMLSSVSSASDLLSVGDRDNKHESKQERKVLQIDKEVIKKIMMEENDYSDLEATCMMADFNEYDAKLQPVLDRYIAHRSLSPDFKVEGVTVQIVMDRLGCDFWSAISDLNYYLTRPDDAKRLLKRETYRFRY